jgi:2-polyprenyl-3-methyl-5-hydroxy-6-metoxy-1,4-benzoquinol methylase
MYEIVDKRSYDTDIKVHYYQCHNCNIVFQDSINLSQRDYFDEFYNNKSIGVSSLRAHEISQGSIYRNILEKVIINNNIKEILDFGCGDGTFLNYIEEYCPNMYNLHGYDISEKVISSNRNKYSNIVFYTKFTLISKKFDLIVLNDVIEHIHPNELDNLTKQIQTILKENGKIFIRTPKIDSIGKIIAGSQWPQFIAVHYLFFTKHFTKLFLTKHSLQIENIFDCKRNFKELWHLFHSMSKKAFIYELVKQFQEDSINALVSREK